MANYRAEARRAAARYGLDPGIFERQIQQESTFDPTARSRAGALGIAQIMPATARAWGVDPMNPRQALNAAAKNMASYVKRYGGIENALRAYNAGPGAIQKSKGYAETNHYVKTILGGSNPKLGRPSPKPTRSPAATTPAAGSDGLLLAAIGAMTPQAQLAQAQRPRVQVTAPTAPSFSARPVTAAGAQVPGQTPAGEESAAQAGPRQLNVGAALEAMQALTPAQRAAVTPARGRTPAAPSSGRGKFQISGPQPKRLKPELVSFARRVADTFGGTFVGLDGSTHSKYTTNGNVSEHYTGNATDIFTVNGRSLKQNQGLLLQVGRAALIAAGMPRAKANKAPFGLYNVGRHQIIFGTNSRALGGDHTDHLHISAR
jgi:hypothetical protein